LSKGLDELDNIPTQKLASEMPDKFTATVISVTRTVKTGQYAGKPILKLELKTQDGISFSTVYNIPKALTGKGQYDKLLEHLKNLKLTVKGMEGKNFMWEREDLEGSMKGHMRHYPIKLVK
jgi:hypothetical protein